MLRVNRGVIRSEPAPIPVMHTLPPARPGAPQNLVFWILAIYTFVRLSVVHELITFKFGLPHLNYVLAPIAFIVIIASGSLPRAIKQRAGVILLLFFVWVVLITPFSTYRTGSITILQTYAMDHLPMYLVIAAAITTVDQCKKLMYILMWAGLFVFANAMANNLQGADRFSLSFGTLMNPNDMATHVLVILPFSIFAGIEKKRFSLSWVIAWIVVAGCVFIVFKTGSRAGFITLFSMCVLIILGISMTKRIMLIVFASMVSIVLLPMLSQGTRERYLSIFRDEEVTTQEGVNARGSSASRRYLLQESLKMTFRHPVFGIGPGQFQTLEARQAKEEGRRGAWLETHNSYTEASAETGLVGFTIYFTLLGYCVMQLYRLRKFTRNSPRELKTVHNMASCTLLCVAGYCINTLFVSLLYKFYLPAIVGITAAVLYTGKREIEWYRASHGLDATRGPMAARTF